MKYLHLTQWSPRKSFGGYETIVRTTASFQRKKHHQVYVVGRVEGESKTTQITQSGVKFIEVGHPMKRCPSTLDVGVLGYFKLIREMFVSLFLLTPHVLSLSRTKKIDAVVFYGIHLFLMSPLLRIFGIKTMLGLEVIQKNPHASPTSLVFWFRLLKYRMFSAIFTYTHYFYLADGTIYNNVELLKKYAGRTPVYYIPWGIDNDGVQHIRSASYIRQLRKNRYGPIILCPRRLVEEKGVRYLLESIPALKKKFPRIAVVFAGDGVLRESLEQRAKELKLEKAVVFTGFLSHEDTLSYMKGSDVVVVPSSGEESFGMVFLEAFLLRIPIVSTWFGGIPNVVEDKKTGLLVPPQNSAELSKAVIQVLSDKKLQKTFTKYGYKAAVTRFSLHDTLRQLDTVVKHINRTL